MPKYTYFKHMREFHMHPDWILIYTSYKRGTKDTRGTVID